MPFSGDTQKMSDPTRHTLYHLALGNRIPATVLPSLLPRSIGGTNDEVNVPLFVYGTLMFADKIGRVARISSVETLAARRMTPARLKGYLRLAVKGAPFPAAVTREMARKVEMLARREWEPMVPGDKGKGTGKARKVVEEEEEGNEKVLPGISGVGRIATEAKSRENTGKGQDVVESGQDLRTTEVEVEEQYIDGMLIFGLDDQQSDRLDDYEGELYTRRRVQVEIELKQDEAMSNGTAFERGSLVDSLTRKTAIVDANVYVWAMDLFQLHPPSLQEWSVDDCLAGGL